MSTHGAYYGHKSGYAGSEWRIDAGYGQKSAASNAVPHFLNDVLLKGWLTKQAVSAHINRNWRRRHITLRHDRIEWRRRTPYEGPAGVLHLTPRTIVTECKTRDHKVSVTTDDRTLVLQFASDPELRTWLEKLRSAIVAVVNTNVGTAAPHAVVAQPSVPPMYAMPNEAPAYAVAVAAGKTQPVAITAMANQHDFNNGKQPVAMGNYQYNGKQPVAMGNYQYQGHYHYGSKSHLW